MPCLAGYCGTHRGRRQPAKTDRCPLTFYALLPLLAVLALLQPTAFTAVVNALGMLAAIRQLH
jgi:sorbitol-specific phosphotransferase system component IIC